MTRLVDGRYKEVALKTARKGITVSDIDQVGKSMSRIKTCGVESDDLTLERFKRWKSAFKNTKLIQTKDLIKEFRQSKESDEIKKFRQSQRLTQTIMTRIPKSLKIGMTELELDWTIRSWARDLGAQSMAFDPIVAFGPHSSRPHHEPTNRRLKKQDIVQIDCGVRLDGYCSDQSRVFFVSSPTKEQQRVYDAVSSAKEAAEKIATPGVTNHALDKAATAVLAEHGLDKYFVHSLGHGVGLEIHEGPSISQHAKRHTLQVGEIITIEPGVYLPGKFGIRLEDEVVIA